MQTFRGHAIEWIALEALTPYERNARVHSEAQLDKLVASIKEFGFTQPLLIDESNLILAGHGRLLAAQRLGMIDVPCVRLTHLDAMQKRAYALADNRLALDADWDLAQLRLELSELNEDKFDVTLTGFSESQIETLLAEPEELGQADSVRAHFEVVAQCDDEERQRELFGRLQSEGYKCRVLTY
jgi:ParB-like chromosome segregation protein Spo0J